MTWDAEEWELRETPERLWWNFDSRYGNVLHAIRDPLCGNSQARVVGEGFDNSRGVGGVELSELYWNSIKIWSAEGREEYPFGACQNCFIQRKVRVDA